MTTQQGPDGPQLPEDDSDGVPEEEPTAVIPVVAAMPIPWKARERIDGPAHRKVSAGGWPVRGVRDWVARRPYVLVVVVFALVVATVAVLAAVRPPSHRAVADPAPPVGPPTPRPGGSAADSAVRPPNPGTTPVPSGSSGSPSATPSASAKPTSSAARASTPPGSSPAPGPAPSVWTSLTVNATRVLARGDSVQTNRTRLAMLSDGNLVIVDEFGATRWTTNTAGSGDRAVFQADGNFVVYDAGSRTLWSSRTDRHNGAVLVLQTDGDVCVIFQGSSIWCAGTAH